MIDHAAAQLKAFNSERQAAAQVAVWMAANVAATATQQAAEAEKETVTKGLDAVKKTQKAAKSAMQDNLAQFAAFTPQPSPQTASVIGPALGAPVPSAMTKPMTTVLDSAQDAVPLANPGDNLPFRLPPPQA